MLESNYEQEIEFVVGIAGTGKSTRLAEIATDRSIVLTPTHQAKRVLERKGVENVFTIHSVLKLVPTINQEARRGQKLQRLKRMGELDLASISTVIIDEFSMINMQILDMLLELLPSSSKVIIFGDDRQLPPVDGEPIEPDYYTDKITELKTQHRAEAPKVVETFTRFANYIANQREMNLTVNLPKGTLKDFNPDTDRILAYTNAKVLELNDIASKHLGLSQELKAGDKVIVNDLPALVKGIGCNYHLLTIYPKCMSKGRLKEGDDLLDAVEETEAEIQKFNTDLSPYDYYTVEIEGVEYNLPANTNHYSYDKELEQEVKEVQFGLIEKYDLDKDTNLKSWCYSNRGYPEVKARGRAWSTYLAHKNLVWNIRRPFATTVHKSQGSEFSTVYIAQDDIKKAIRNGYYVQYARLMYVALSRAIHKVVIV